MKYVSINRLQDFEFHDARFLLKSFSDGCLTVSAEGLNIHRQAAQNGGACDMEIETATLTFERFTVESFRLSEATVYDAAGNLIRTDPPNPVLHGEQAAVCLFRALEEGLWLYDLEPQMGNAGYRCDVCAAAASTYFFAVFSFSKVTVSWEQYCGKAWYEEKPTCP